MPPIGWDIDTAEHWAENHRTPEHRLLSAIVCRAILDYCNSRSTYIRGQAEEYLFDDDDRRPWSFFWIAKQLSDDPGGLIASFRQGIRSTPRGKLKVSTLYLRGPK